MPPENNLPDDLDRLLYALPGEAAPPDLARKIQRAVGRQRRRKNQVRAGLCTLMALGGIWLTLPAVKAWPALMTVPDSGTLLLQNSLTWLEQDAATMAGNLYDSLATLQGGVMNALEITVWLGLAALGCSALLAMGALMGNRKLTEV